jgi:hypothetical protein
MPRADFLVPIHLIRTEGGHGTQAQPELAPRSLRFDKVHGSYRNFRRFDQRAFLVRQGVGQSHARSCRHDRVFGQTSVGMQSERGPVQA